jgi:hypothetical protein
MWIKIGLLTLCVLTLACKSLPKNKLCPVTEQAIQLLTNPSIEFNSTKEYALCFEVELNTHNGGLINFIILQTTTCKILEKGSLRPGYIKWISASEIELLNLPGAIDGDVDLTNFKKIITLKTQKS